MKTAATTKKYGEGFEICPEKLAKAGSYNQYLDKSTRSECITKISLI